MTHPQPAEPQFATPMATGAAATHELFESYLAAGFSRGEALHMVTAMLVAGLHVNAIKGQQQ